MPPAEVSRPGAPTGSPVVSVVVPTHDRRRLLVQTLGSILGQREVDLEVLVVDDGSRDGTAEVVAGLGDARVRLLRHDTPQGVAAARNRGIAEATGTWLAFCDDDDLWAPDKLARQLQAAHQTGRGWVYTGEVRIDLRQRIVGGTHPPPSRRRRRGPRRCRPSCGRWYERPGAGGPACPGPTDHRRRRRPPMNRVLWRCRGCEPR